MLLITKLYTILEASPSSRTMLLRAATSTPGCISAWITASTTEDFPDAQKRGGGNHGVALVREMDKVKGAR
jgi:hypothetical protein